MRITTHFYLAPLTALFLGTAAQGVTIYSDADSFGGLNSGPSTPIGQTVTSGQSVLGSFNFVVDDGTSGFSIGSPYPSFERDTYVSSLGFTAGSDTVVSGTGFMKFFVREGVSDFEIFTISMADITFQASVFSTAFSLSSGVTATVEGSINTSGAVDYAITANSGSFILDAAYMEIEAQPTTQAVDDGGITAVLLGSAIFGIAAFRTKFSQESAL
jgi:hypothetical protein